MLLHGGCSVVPPAGDAAAGTQASAVPVAAATVLLHVPAPTGTRIGSAFAWYGRLLLTNAHVVHEVNPGGAVSAERAGRAIRVLLVARSSRMDLALLCELSGDVPAAPAVRLEPVRPTEPIFAAGPITLSAQARMVVLRGEVSLIAQHDPRFGPGWIAQLPGARPGFSGTAVFDGRGRMIGMLTAIRIGTNRGSAFVPVRPAPTAAAGHETQAFVLEAAAIHAEVANMLVEAREASAGSSDGGCPGY